ncbi:MAG: hypothetical protein H7210_03585 [Pyrinomonadaceae bacterium]|nr:hypothetical protein [Phycisphaerales bacterium]
MLKSSPVLPSPASPEARDTLFGDSPMESWPSASVRQPAGEPWDSFILARNAVSAGREAEAIKCWKKICAMPDLESRHYLQAWHFLRAAGTPAPADKAKVLLGVVIEVPLNGGLDLLAAYPGGSARFYSHAGGGVVWDHPNASLDPAIDTLLTEASRILKVIGPWEKPRPPAPPAGAIRVNVLSAAGLHFGEGPFAALARDALAGPAIDAATDLMQQLMAQTSAPGAGAR